MGLTQRPYSGEADNYRDTAFRLYQSLGFDVAGGFACHLFGGAFRHNITTLLAAFRAQVQDPIGGADHIQVVLDHQHRGTGFNQPVEHVQQACAGVARCAAPG